MEGHNDPIFILENMRCPAFLAENGIIIHANQLASMYFITPGTSVASLISIGAEEYAEFTQGRLHLTLQLQDIPTDAVIHRSGTMELILPEQPSNQQILQALAQSSVQYRGPLSNMISTFDRISAALPEELQTDVQRFNRWMDQLHRLTINHSDAFYIGQSDSSSMEYVQIVSFVQEILEKAGCALEKTGLKVQWSLPKEAIFTLADSDKLERSLYNLLSNAAKHAPPGSTIEVRLVNRKQRLYLSVLDEGPGIPLDSMGDIFTRYQRPPMLEDPINGMGLGMVVIKATATLHGGTVLVDHAEDGKNRVTMTLPIQQRKQAMVHAPKLRTDYAGGKDRCLLELSDVLPPSLYSKRSDK